MLLGRKNNQKPKDDDVSFLPTNIIERSDRLSGAWLDRSIKRDSENKKGAPDADAAKKKNRK